MSEKKYQIFISYRYVDADGFVADELHKALIDFSVPHSLRKNMDNPDVYKIDRVFQDKIKLSVAESLWDAIEEALSETEYLVVICSPRVEKDSWCYKEIETFINKHGADKVIAVLSEGEPADVIPDIMRVNGKIPFAADVRGASKKEIKKRIKEAIPRIVAPIFGLEYEQLRNRFQEERWRKKLKLMMGVSAVVVAAAVFSTIQMWEIRRQKAKLEKQMVENLFQQEKILTLLAENEINSGNFDAAIENLLKGLPDNIANPEYPIYNQACYDLSKALMVYENGESYSCAKKPLTDPETGELIVASKTKQIDNNRMLLACDSVSLGYIWNINEGKADLKFHLAYYNDEVFSDDKNNYFFDSAGDQNIAITDNVIYISDATCIRAISLNDYKTLWEIDMDYTMAIDVYEDIVVACNIGDVRVINAKTGELISFRNDFDDDFENQKFKHAFLSKDKKSVIIRAEYDSELEYSYMYRQDSEEDVDLEADRELYMSKIKAYMYRVSIDDLALIEKKKIGGAGSVSYWIDPSRESLYVFEYMRYADDHDIYNQESNYARVCAYDLKDFSERWSLNSENNIGQAYFFDNSLMKDKIYFVASNTIIEVLRETGESVYSGEFSSDIAAIELNDVSYNNEDEAEYCFEVLCYDGSVFVQIDSPFSFSPKDIGDLTETDGQFYRFGNRYVIPYTDGSYYYDVNKLVSPYGTNVSYEMMPEIDQSVVKSNASTNFGEEQFGIKIEFDDKNNVVDIIKSGKLVCTYSYENDIITETLVTPDSRFVFLMFGHSDTVMINVGNGNVTEDDIIKIGDIDVKMTCMTKNPNEWIVMTDKYGENEFSAYVFDEKNKTFEKYLLLKEFLIYDSKENMIYEDCGKGYMKVPLYSIEELVELATKYMKGH